MATPVWFPTVDWSTGDTPTAAQFDGLLRDNLDHLGTPVSAQASRSTNLSIATSTFTDVTLPSEAWDTDSLHSTSSNTDRFTIPTGLDGIYLVHGIITFAVNSTGARTLTVAKNGAGMQVTTFANAGTAAPVLSGARILRLVAGDYVSIEAWQDSGGNLNVTQAEVTVIKISN